MPNAKKREKQFPCHCAKKDSWHANRYVIVKVKVVPLVPYSLAYFSRIFCYALSIHFIETNSREKVKKRKGAFAPKKIKNLQFRAAWRH
jgi:hypothetical protein